MRCEKNRVVPSFSSSSALQLIEPITAVGTNSVNTEGLAGLRACPTESATPTVAEGYAFAVLISFVFTVHNTTIAELVQMSGP